jgi:signal peptidase I
LTATLKKLWKNEIVQTAVIIGLMALAVLGFWFGAQMILNTRYPALAVVSGSMCIPQDNLCDVWTHPFERTLHVGDLIVLQGVNPEDLNANYSNSDIIVYQDPRHPADPSQMIVHRIVAKQEINGTWYFQTKGDGNGVKWPNPVDPAYYDSWNLPNGVPQDQIYGKVVMRIPWVGHVILFMQRSPFGLPIIIALIIIIVIVEFIAPLLGGKKAQTAEPEQQKETQQQP